MEQDGDTAQTLESCGDMFTFFRNSVVQCKQLGSQKAIFDLYIVFKKYLGVYAKKILNDNLPKSSSLASIILKDGVRPLWGAVLLISHHAYMIEGVAYHQVYSSMQRIGKML